MNAKEGAIIFAQRAEDCVRLLNVARVGEGLFRAQLVGLL